MKKYKVVISGAAGFIGRRLVVRAAKMYGAKNILALVWNRNTDWDNQGKEIIRGVGVTMLEVDIATGDGLKMLKNQSPEIFFHLAAITDTSETNYSANDEGTENLIKSFKSIKRVIYTSTIALFSGRLNCNKVIKETDLPAPTNEYGRSKLRAEKFLISEADKGMFKLTVVRLPTVYGENSRKNSLFDFLNKIVDKNSLLARLNWPGLTSLVYVDDVAKVLINLKEEGIYHFGTDLATLADCCKVIYQAKNKDYRQINLGRFIWKVISFSRPVIYRIENFIPVRFYNLFWRASLTIDNVFWCDSKRIEKELKYSKWVKFETISDYF